MRMFCIGCKFETQKSTGGTLLKVTVPGVSCFPVVLEQSHKYFSFLFFFLFSVKQKLAG